MFKAIGLIVTLIALRVLMPELFGAIVEAGTKFFHAIGHLADIISSSDFSFQGPNVAGANYIPNVR